MTQAEIMKAIKTLLDQIANGYHLTDQDIEKAKHASRILNKIVKDITK